MKWPAAEAVKDLHEDLIRKFSNAQVGSGETWFADAPVPHVMRVKATYQYMGRAATLKLLCFISQDGRKKGFQGFMEEDKTMDEMTTRGDRPLISYVVGTPGYGKTTCLRASHGYMYAKFHLSSQALSSSSPPAADLSLSSQPSTSSSAAVSKKCLRQRVIYLDGEQFVQDPGLALGTALLLSHYDCSDIAERIRSDLDLKAVLGLLSTQAWREEVYVLLDDGNVMDPDDIASRRQDYNSRLKAWNALEFLSTCCVVIVCASVKSWILGTLVRDKGADHVSFSGGFTDDERSKYLYRIGKQLSVTEEDVTGSVPRLLHHYFSNESQLDASYRWFYAGIRKYVDDEIKRDGDAAERLVGIFSGTTAVFELDDVMKSGCFFKGTDGTAHCLTRHLRSFAITYLISKLDCRTLETATKIMERWLCTMSNDTNVSRIGFNAESAALTAFSKLELSVTLPEPQPRVIQVTDGETPVPARVEDCLAIMKALAKDPGYIEFVRPVKDLWPTRAEDYARVIDRPMDLGTVHSRLRAGAYGVSLQSFVDDVLLTFDNAMRYNDENVSIHQLAKTMRQKFCTLLQGRTLPGSEVPQLKLKAQEVEHFHGKFQWSMMKGKHQKLFIPYSFNHLGADAYYEDRDNVVIIQISIALNARETHESTRQLMKSCPPSEKRRKFILWVLARGGGWQHYPGDGFEELLVPFGSLLATLRCVDLRCEVMRTMGDEGCLTCGLSEPVLQTAGNTNTWHQCEGCLFWCHEVCLTKEEAEYLTKGKHFRCYGCRSGEPMTGHQGHGGIGTGGRQLKRRRMLEID